MENSYIYKNNNSYIAPGYIRIKTELRILQNIYDKSLKITLEIKIYLQHNELSKSKTKVKYKQ